MSTEIVNVESTAACPVPQLTMRPISELIKMDEYREELFKAMVKGDSGTGAHYGIVPGIKGNLVYKEGIMFIEAAFNITGGDPHVEKEDIPIVLSDGTEALHVRFTVKVPLIDMATGAVIAVGLGAASTLEPKYRYRGQNRTCPKCKSEAVRKGLDKYGGGWFCDKKEGCGAKFKDGDPAIVEQIVGKVENLDPTDIYDTVLSMAEKRAEGRIVLDKTQMKRWFRLPGTVEDGGRKYSESGQGNGNPEPPREPKPKPSETQMKEICERTYGFFMDPVKVAEFMTKHTDYRTNPLTKPEQITTLREWTLIGSKLKALEKAEKDAK